MRIIIAGGGLTAQYIAKRLIKERHELVIIENDPHRATQLEEELDALVIRADTAHLATWQQHALKRADMVIGLTDSDQTNILVCLIADEHLPEAIKAVRLRTPEYASWHDLLERRGIRLDRVVHPESDVVSRIFRVCRVPGVSDIRDFAEGRIKVFGMNIDPGSPLAGKSLVDLEQERGHLAATIAMIFRDQGVIIPHGSATLREGDHIYVVTTDQQLNEVLAFMGIEQQTSLRQVFIVGGKVGREVAAALEQGGIHVKLFERDPQRCAELAEQLPGSMVINADGTDQQTLLRENIEGVDAFIALTANDNANLITALLARRLGARKLVALINNVETLPLARRLGINTTLSLRVKAADAVLEFIRKGGVSSVRTFQEDQAEAIELVAPQNSIYICRPLREIRFPRNAIVGAIVRPNGESIIPRGDAVIQAGDRVVFFAAEVSMAELESDFLATIDAP